MTGSSPAHPWSRMAITLLTIAAAIAFIGAVAMIASTQPSPADGPGALARGGGGGGTADENPEKEEQAEQAAERAEAYEQAQEKGLVGQARPTGAAAAAPATGWLGERP